MAKSQATFMKKQLEKNRAKKKEDKEWRKLEIMNKQKERFEKER